MKFQIDAVGKGTNQPVRVELEGTDLQSVMAQAGEMGLTQVRVKPIQDGAASAPSAAGGTPAGGYGKESAYGGNAYAGVGGATDAVKGYPSAKGGGSGLKILLVLGAVMVLLVAAVVAGAAWVYWASGPSAGGKAPGTANGATLDPRLYLPVSKDGDLVVSASANVPKVLGLGAAKKLRQMTGIDDVLARGLMVTLDDMDEMLLVGSGPSEQMAAARWFAVIKLKRDMDVPNLVKNNEIAGKSEKIEGYDVYDTTAGAAGRSALSAAMRSYLVKIGPGTYLTCECRPVELAEYLKRVKAGTKVEFSASVKSALAEIRGGDVVLCADMGRQTDPTAPLAVAASVVVETMRVTGEGAALMRDEASARKEYDDYLKNGKGEVESTLPGTVITQKGSFLKAEGNMSSVAIEEKAKGLGGFLPFGR